MKMLRHPMISNQTLPPDLISTLEGLLAQLPAPPSARTARLVRAPTARNRVEEATDAVTGNRAGLIAESVDLLCHLAVLWHDRGIDPREVRAGLARRASVPGIVRKRPKKGAAKRALEALETAGPATARRVQGQRSARSIARATRSAGCG